MSASKILLVSGDKGFIVFDKKFRSICTIQLDSKTKPEIYFAERQLDQLIFVFKKQGSKEFYKTAHSVPKDF